MRTILIDGKRYDWHQIRQLRRQQILESRRIQQLTLFEMVDDTRPSSQKTADGRYSQPLLFEPQ